MNYKSCCPKCGVKLTRRQYFSTWRIHFRCRSCGARFRLTAIGYLMYLIATVIYLLWLGLVLDHIIRPAAALVLVLLTFVAGVWLLPILTPMRIKSGE